ncbi:LptF/LptG family permease [Acidisoma silvae]|uniref:LptF/LptG family permease n=1 Tax=Acidisoma silvae TaxID=2802396 RepID=A0A963YQX4_9PROT|nr:LptF/LptG family permease [Acidisoma silvae]MCB8875181.1 LptF/LptG family permease [Acidisoma silvae]
MGFSVRTPRARSPRTLERYLLSLCARPFAATLLVVLPALLLERLLRLFDLLADQDVPAQFVGRMLLDLVPQYLGLALPAALFLGIYFVIARMSADNELEAMQNAGLSMAWISRPFFILGFLLMFVAYGLFSYVQPLARYAFREAFWAATESGWNATIPPGQIIHVSKNLVVTADGVDRATGALRHVLAFQRKENGTEEVTTGITGSLSLVAHGNDVFLTLNNGKRLDLKPNGTIGTETSATSAMERAFVLPLRAFRKRGDDEREMTTGELWSARYDAHPPEPLRRLNGELYSRIIRSISMAVLPLMAVSIGISAKRAKRQYGIAVGFLILILYDHAIQLTAALGTAGLIDPRAPLWGIFAVFTLFCGWMFSRASRHTSEGPLDPLFNRLEDATALVAGGLRRLSGTFRRKQPAR